MQPPGPHDADGGRPDGNPQRESVDYDHRELVALLADADLAVAQDPHAADEESVATGASSTTPTPSAPTTTR
ncbi:hypothetical protein BRD11_02910 [Halobacteriales archaeon SW_12_69_24]|nr:MAG: hypothetical protein BRD11_02910 [Halobacteriales archaeon SW_12_69_24]